MKRHRTKAADPASQPDLFDQPVAHPVQAPLPASSPPDPAALADGALLQAFVNADLSCVAALADAIVQRRPKGWQDAACALWMRFYGFGQDKACLEQTTVIRMLRETRDRTLLQHILARGGIPSHFDGDILRAAVVCGIRLDATRIHTGLASPDPDLRRSALELAMVSGLAPRDLHPILTDPDAGCRHMAAILLAEAGDPEGREPLIRLLKISPSERALEALSAYDDEDSLVTLGQIGRRDLQWCESIREIIENSGHPKARAIAASLPMPHSIPD